MIRTKLPIAFTGLIFLTLLSWHCTKIDTTNLGGGLIPAVDNVNTFDTTISIIVNNIDSIPLGKGCAIVYPTDEHALGYISNDPLFGTTKATIYTELKPLTFPFAFEAKPADRTLDSAVLVLSYKRSYGDSVTSQTVEVHEISGTFSADSSSCTTYPFKTAILGSKTFIPMRLSDSVKVTGDTSSNQLRIKLTNTTFGQALLAQDTIQTDSLFKIFLKGFAIVPLNSGNGLTYYGLTDANTKLAIYYKYKRTGLADTSIITYFSLYNGDQSANNIVRNRTGAEVNNSSNANSNSGGDNFAYVQTTPGTFVQLKIPGLAGLSNRIVHRAELILEQVSPTATDKIFGPPPFLFLEMKDSANGVYHPLGCDFTVVSGLPDISTYGGFRTVVKNSTGDSVSRYVFNISRFVQMNITKQKIFPTLRLRAPEYVITPATYVDDCNMSIAPLLFSMNDIAQGRVKLVGGSTAVNRIRLHIIYSKL